MGTSDVLYICVVFYSAIGAECPPEGFEFDNVGKVSKQQILCPQRQAGCMAIESDFAHEKCIV